MPSISNHHQQTAVMPTVNGPFKDHLTLNVGEDLRICHFNIEGISKAKCEVLTKIMNKERIDVIALHETHTKDDNDLQKRGYIAGYTVIGAIHHKQYGIATYVKENIDDTMVVHKANSGNTQVLSTKIGSITVTNVYKPPNNKWESDPMKTFEHPAIYVGDFNSHNMAWGYDIKNKGTFRSARWLKEYTPDLSIISKPPNDSKQLASRRILCDFPHSQHRPVVLEYGLKIPIIRSIPKPRWNFRKANWTEFAKELDHLIQWIPAKAECYDRFVGAIKMIAKKHIPRGFRKQFIPGWDETCNELYAEFQRSKDNNIADELINNLNLIRKQRWHEKTENLDFTHSSHKAWSLMKKLGTSNNITKGQHTLRPNSVATRLKSVGKLSVDKEHNRLIKTELRNHRKMLMPHPTLDAAFTQNDVTPCKKLFTLLDRMLTNRRFKVFLGNKESNWRTVLNGLPQGSVLAPTLFNLFIHDLPVTKGLKFQYADDIAIAYQSTDLEDSGKALTEDLSTMNKYFSKWRLKPNPTKTEVCAFHLNNKKAREELKVTFQGVQLKHNFTPKYLGITLDRTLTFKEHLVKTGKKVRSRVNLIQKLAGTGWGASAKTLRTAALALTYSAAEYGAQVWCNSAYVEKVDTQLHSVIKAEDRRNSLLAERLEDIPALRLRSRKPPWKTAKDLIRSGFETKKCWCDEWTNSTLPIKNKNLVMDPNQGVMGMELPRHEWSVLNCLRTGHGRCADMMFKWRLQDSPACDCGNDRQTINHIIKECQIRKFNQGIEGIHAITPEAVKWIRELDVHL
ncbi:hypothetical protein AGLY_016661 [Aphis glycines]|uniref:Reverse transcriptase domain-containing protein n=1 Tax=Aphis glycines TaxID=307491 RepID=A0A6G0SXA7_APHGL|nr:hypothetical protein AGLY_016661 [Aphis glycines]